MSATTWSERKSSEHLKDYFTIPNEYIGNIRKANLVWFQLTSMGKHGCMFSHVVKQSTVAGKAAL